ncbi:MAG: hypothetical protein WHS65_04280 [Melioribacteraceae bacterium]
MNFNQNKSLKIFFIVYLLVITIGVSTGLTFLQHTTSLTPKGAVARFNGDEIKSEDIIENYPKPISEMLLTTHNHVLGLSFIFLSVGLIFYFYTRINERWKLFLMIEPLISIVVTFGSIWLMRFVNKNFVYLAAASSFLMYLCFYIMVSIALFELFKKR